MTRPLPIPASVPFWPRNITWALSLVWGLCIAASFILPGWLTNPGHSGWDKLGEFLMIQFTAAGIAAFALLLTVVFWIVGQIGPWTRAVGILSAAVTAAVLTWLTVFAE